MIRATHLGILEIVARGPDQMSPAVRAELVRLNELLLRILVLSDREPKPKGRPPRYPRTADR